MKPLFDTETIAFASVLALWTAVLLLYSAVISGAL
jgi:hypothetical protein